MNTFDEGYIARRNLTHIIMTCQRRSMEASVTVTHAEMVWHFASIMAKDARGGVDLVGFIIDQIDGRAGQEETSLAKAHPGYAQDVASKVAIFALGLLASRPALDRIVHGALLAGGHTIDIQLSASHVLVNVEGHLFRCQTNFMIASDAGDTAALH